MNTSRPVRDIMSTDLVTISPNTTTKEIKAIFDHEHFHHLPVVERGDKLVGIISKHDFMQFAYILSLRTTGKTWSENEYQTLCASDIMTRYPLSLDPEDTIGLAADIFLANKFHALPILEEERLVGLVTTHDLLLFSYNAPVSDEEEDVERF